MTRRSHPPAGSVADQTMSAALQEAERAGHSYVGCEHLLLALVRDNGDEVAQLLAGAGVALTKARAAVSHVVAEGRGDGPRWGQADLLATMGIDLAAIKRRVRADFGPRAVEELYASRIGRRLPRGPLCGLTIAPTLKDAFGVAVDTARRERREVDSAHLLLALLDTDSAGLHAVLAGLGIEQPGLRTTVTARLPAAS